MRRKVRQFWHPAECNGGWHCSEIAWHDPSLGQQYCSFLFVFYLNFLWIFSKLRNPIWRIQILNQSKCFNVYPFGHTTLLDALWKSKSTQSGETCGRHVHCPPSQSTPPNVFICLLSFATTFNFVHVNKFLLFVSQFHKSTKYSLYVWYLLLPYTCELSSSSYCPKISIS